MLEGSFSVVKEMARVHRATIELGMDLGGWLSTQEFKVVLGFPPRGVLTLISCKSTRDPSFAQSVVFNVSSKGNTEEKKVAARTPESEKLAKGDGISGVWENTNQPKMKYIFLPHWTSRD